MGFPKKIKDIFSLGMSNLFAKIILGIFWLYIATILTKSQYGELGFLISIAFVGGAISLLGLRSTIVVYESKNENIFPPSFIIGLISSSITTSIVYVLTQNISVSILVMGITVFELLLSAVNSKKRFGDFAKYRIFRAILTILFAIVLYQYIGINGIILGYFISSLFILKELPSFLKNKEIKFSILKQKIRFILERWATRLSQIFFTWGDKLVIGSLFGFSLLGSFTFATQYLLLLDAIPRSMGQYLLPHESEGMPNKKLKIFFIGIACIVAVVSIMVIPFGIDTLLPKYQDVIFPIQIMSIAIIPLSISTIQQSEFLGKENSRIVLIGSIIQSSLYFVSIIVLGQWYGLEGLAVGFVLATIARMIFYFFGGISFKNKLNANTPN